MYKYKNICIWICICNYWQKHHWLLYVCRTIEGGSLEVLLLSSTNFGEGTGGALVQPRLMNTTLALFQAGVPFKTNDDSLGTLEQNIGMLFSKC